MRKQRTPFLRFSAWLKTIFSLVAIALLLMLVSSVLNLGTISPQYRSLPQHAAQAPDSQPGKSTLLDSSTYPQSGPHNTPTGWELYTDHRYGYSIQYPLGWYVKPTESSGYGSVAIFTNFDTKLASGGTENLGPDRIKVSITLLEDAEFEALTSTSKLNRVTSQSVMSQELMSVAGQNGVRYTYESDVFEPTMEVLFPNPKKGAFQVLIGPTDSHHMPLVQQMLASFQLVK